MQETLIKRVGEEKRWQLCYLTLRYPNQACTIARTKAIPSFWLKHELDQVGVQNRVNLHLLTLNSIISLTSIGNLWTRVFTWLWKAVGCSSCSECLGWDDTYTHPCLGKKENPTIIVSGPFLGSTVHPRYFSRLSGKICYRSWTISSTRAKKLFMLCFLPSLHISSASDSSTAH